MRDKTQISNWVVASLNFWDGDEICLTTDGEKYYLHFSGNESILDFTNDYEAKCMFYDLADEVMNEKLGMDI